MHDVLCKMVLYEMPMRFDLLGVKNLLDLLIILVLSVHLVAMNLAGAGPLFGIWLGRRGESNDPVWDRLGQKVAWLSFWAFLLGMITGGGQMFFAPSDGLWEALARFPNRGLWIAAAELLFSLVCLALYAGYWTTLRKHRWWHATLALLSSSNLLYHFPPLMSVIGKLANDPTWAETPVLDRAALLPLMGRAEIVALSVHFVLASLAVSAVAVLWLSSKSKEASKSKRDDWEKTTLPLVRRAAWVALLTSAVQLPVGFWLLVSLPQTIRTSMMGDSAIASLAFVGAMLLTFVLFQRLLTVAIGTIESGDLRMVGWVLATLVLLMTATLYESRLDRKPLRANAAQKKTAVTQYAPRLLWVSK